MNSQTSLPLNLEARKKRKKQFEASEIENENIYLKSLGREPISSLDQKDINISDFKKILLEQTHVVMADFINLAKTYNYSW